MEDQDGQQRALAQAPELEGDTVPPHLHRAEQHEVHQATVPAPVRVCRAFAGRAEALPMPGSDETFIVRVRRHEGDAVVEQPRLSRRLRISDVTEVGPLILRWLGRAPAETDRPPTGPAETEV